MEEKIYKAKEFAELIKVTVATLQIWDKKGILKAKRTPTNRMFYTEKQYKKYKEGSERRGKGEEVEEILKQLETTIKGISLLLEDEKYGFKAEMTYEQEELVKAIKRRGEKVLKEKGVIIGRTGDIEEEIINEMLSAIER